ncbi:hypothetical protein WJX84_004322 [Apatococcus fuscideae]|uniref:Uncharacterized protein n=1 Tax=Apatococcus fuscideae TaxID=2026836 RepID=A0AAW1T1L8_9CHLO
MSFDTRSQSASLPTYARRAFGGLSTSFRAFVRSTRQPQSQQRQALREIITSSSTGHSIPDNRPQTKLKAAANFLQTTQNKGQDHSEPDARPAQERTHKQSSASLVFQHFLATEGLRDEEIRLLLRQDRAVGVAAMTFTSLAAEGLGQASMGVASAALSTAVSHVKELKSFQDRLEAKQAAGAASAQAWFDDLAAQARDQYSIFQASATEVSELASRKLSWKKSYAGLQAWLKPLTDPPASATSRWTSWATPRPVTKPVASTSQPLPSTPPAAAASGTHAFQGNKQQASSPATSGHDAPSSAPAGVRTEATRSPTPAQTPSRGPPPCKPSARPSLDPVQPDIAETLQGLPPLIPAVVEEHSGLGPEATAPESPQLQSASATTAHSSGRQGVPQGEAQGTQGPATVRNDQQSRQSSEAAAPPVQSLGKAQAGQKPTYQASAAASNAILLAQDVKPVAAALKPSKEEEQRTGAATKSRRQTSEADATSKLWLAAASAAEATRAAEGRTYSPSRAWNPAGCQPGVPASAAAAAAVDAQRQAMQVRRPGQVHPASLTSPQQAEGMRSCAAWQPGVGQSPGAAALCEQQRSQLSVHRPEPRPAPSQDTHARSAEAGTSTGRGKTAVDQPGAPRDPSAQLWMRAAAAAETARRGASPQAPAPHQGTPTVPELSPANKAQTSPGPVHAGARPTHEAALSASGSSPSSSNSSVMSSAQAGAGKSAVGPLRHDRPAAGASASSRGVKAEAGIALGVGGGQSGGGSGWQGGSGGGGSGKSRRTASADGGDSAQRRPYWLHWALLLLLFAACILTVLSLRTPHDKSEEHKNLKLRGGSLGLLGLSIFVAFGSGSSSIV